MKQPLILAAFSIILFFSCNNKGEPDTSAQTDTDTSGVVKIMIPSSVCYTGTVGKDSFYLKTELFPNVVTGHLSYIFYEKDGNNGEIDGKMIGDTLIADYTYMSEGVRSVRQVAFLVNGNTATEGHAPWRKRGGSWFLKIPLPLIFPGVPHFIKLIAPFNSFLRVTK